MIWVFCVRSSAVRRDFDPGVLHLLEAEFLHRAKSIGQKQEVCRIKSGYIGKNQYVGLSINMSGEKLKYRPKGFTVGAGRSRLYGSSPQAKVA
jgi:hypothetical protein